MNFPSKQSILCRRCSTRTVIIVSIIIFMFFINLFISEPHNDDIRVQTLLKLAENKSFCSPRSARRGFNQRVLSVSAYESTDNIYLHANLTWQFIHLFTREAKKFYPSWVVRVYHYNLVSKTKEDMEQLESLYDNLDFCPSEDLPVLGNVIHKLPGKVHRFLPSVDPLVSIMMVRDLDSEIFEREVHAVDEWLSTTRYAFHIMRDHYYHKFKMLGGLWGVATNRLSQSDRLKIANILLPSKNEKIQKHFYRTYARAGDQRLLADYMWPLARRNALAHDAVTCVWSTFVYGTDTRPFPSQREHPSCFVGCPKPCCIRNTEYARRYSPYTRCPRSCRPAEHKDWLYC